MMEASEFIRLAEPDRSTKQNALKTKKQKTVTEIIHDQLGPGLDPDMFLDVISDDSKNNEDSNRAK